MLRADANGHAKVVFVPGQGDKARTGRSFDRIVVVILENTNYADALAHPYLKSLTTLQNPTGRLLSNYHAVTHPSQPNYIAQIAGDTFGVGDDGNHADYPTPGACFLGSSAASTTGCSSTASYVRKHNPFVSFSGITSSPARCKHLVDEAALDADIAAGSVPQVAFYYPNQVAFLPKPQMAM
ncbi:hypothetical protein WJX72_008558 [[Myrmecia] bisecta]|uniref:Acid phosphatase n=1 Tax=[Myrmecia] bisecta TaxID=41462 RepID=A0AAW1PP47_9CHLO